MPRRRRRPPRPPPTIPNSGRDSSMSSATSIDKGLPSKGGNYVDAGRGGRDRRGRGQRAADPDDSRSFRLQTEGERLEAQEGRVDPGFHVWHFFVLLSLIAATIAV